jgi:hypothetical protein
VIEIVTLSLASDADPADFVAVDATMQQEFFYLQPGLVRRTTARADDGTWLIVTIWEADANADAAFAQLPSAPASAKWLQLVDRESLQRKRYNTL